MHSLLRLTRTRAVLYGLIILVVWYQLSHQPTRPYFETRTIEEELVEDLHTTVLDLPIERPAPPAPAPPPAAPVPPPVEEPLFVAPPAKPAPAPDIPAQPEPPSAHEPTDEIHLPSDEWQDDPMQHFQNLNIAPIVTPISAPTTPDERAVVTALYSDAYAHAAAVLGHSVKTAGVAARLILMYIPGQVSEKALCIAKTQGWEPFAVERIPPPHNGHRIHSTFVDQYTKLRLWTLDTIGIKSAIYLDGDILVRRPFNELFDLPYSFAAVPDGSSTHFNAGMMLLKPDSAVFADLVKKMETAEYNLEWAEQTYLNLYFGAAAVKLPLIYNANLYLKEASPVFWEALQDEMAVLHYTTTKPFPPYDGRLVPLDEMEQMIDKHVFFGWIYKPELKLWRESWRDMKEKDYDTLEKCQSLG